MLSNWKELLFRISSMPSVSNFFINLECNDPGCFSFLNKMVCFPNSWGILLCIYIYIYMYKSGFFLPMNQETRVQSQVESSKRLKKWYLMPLCLTLRIMTYGSRVKWSNPGKGVVLSPTPQCSSYWKESLWGTLDYNRQLYIYIYIYI